MRSRCTAAIHRLFHWLGPATLGHQGGDLVNRGLDRDTPILGPTLPAEMLEEPLPIRAIVQEAVGVNPEHVALPPAAPVGEPWLGQRTRLGPTVMDLVASDAAAGPGDRTLRCDLVGGQGRRHVQQSQARNVATLEPCRVAQLTAE